MFGMGWKCVCVMCGVCAVCAVCCVCGVCGVGCAGDVGFIGGVCNVRGVYVKFNMSVIGCEFVVFLSVGLVLVFALRRGFHFVFLSLEGFGTLMCRLGERCFWQNEVF